MLRRMGLLNFVILNLIVIARIGIWSFFEFWGFGFQKCYASCNGFVTGLLRVRPQFRSHFADVLRVLRLQTGGRGVRAGSLLFLALTPTPTLTRPAVVFYLPDGDRVRVRGSSGGGKRFMGITNSTDTLTPPSWLTMVTYSNEFFSAPGVQSSEFSCTLPPIQHSQPRAHNHGYAPTGPRSDAVGRRILRDRMFFFSRGFA
jgi:hypothetical protein